MLCRLGPKAVKAERALLLYEVVKNYAWLGFKFHIYHRFLYRISNREKESREELTRIFAPVHNLEVQLQSEPHDSAQVEFL